MLKIDLACHPWPLLLMFKRRWIHPFFPPAFVECCSSLKRPVFSEWPACPLLLKDTYTLLQRLSAAPDFAFALFTTLTPALCTDAVLDFQVGGPWWWDRGGWRGLSVERDVLDLPRWQIAGNIPRASARSAWQLFSLRWIASTRAFMESWRLLQVWAQADCFFSRLFRLCFFSVACLIRDGCGTAATTKEPRICAADGRPTNSFGFGRRTIMSASNSFSKKNGLF